MGDRLELIVDEQLWSHCDEAFGGEGGGRRRGREREGEEGGGVKGERKRKGVEGEAEGNKGGKNYEHKLGSHAWLDLWYLLHFFTPL